MNPVDVIRVGVMGLRFGARVHVPAFRGDSRCVVTALAGRTLDSTAAVAADLGIPGSYAGWRALLSEGPIDAVSIAVPPPEQPAIIAEAARHGTHVFCEKPLAATVAAAEEAVAVVRASGVVHAQDCTGWPHCRPVFRGHPERPHSGAKPRGWPARAAMDPVAKLTQ